MVKKIEIDKRNGIVLCTWLYDGRILKFYIKKERKTIYVCEECEDIWENLQDFVNNLPSNHATVRKYLETIEDDLPVFIKKEEWGKYIRNDGFLYIDEIRPFLDDNVVVKEL